MKKITEELRDKKGRKINEGILQKVVDWIVGNKIQRDYQTDPEWIKLKTLALKIKENQRKLKQLEIDKQKAAAALRPQLMDLNERLNDPEYKKWFSGVFKPNYYD